MLFSDTKLESKIMTCADSTTGRYFLYTLFVVVQFRVIVLQSSPANASNRDLGFIFHLQSNLLNTPDVGISNRSIAACRFRPLSLAEADDRELYPGGPDVNLPSAGTHFGTPTAYTCIAFPGDSTPFEHNIIRNILTPSHNPP